MRKAFRHAVALSLLSWLVAPRVHAQYDPGATVGLGQGMIANNGVIGNLAIGSQGLERDARGDADRARAASPRTAPAALTYVGDAGVHRQVQADIVNFLAHGDASKRDEAKRVVEQGELLETFDRLMSRPAFDRRNLGDVFAAYLVMSWEVVNGADAHAQPAGVDAVRAKSSAALARDGRVRAMSDADKQRLAETLAYLAMIAVTAQRDLRRSGNTAALEQLRAGVRLSTRKMIGVDVKGLRLTENGLARWRRRAPACGNAGVRRVKCRRRLRRAGVSVHAMPARPARRVLQAAVDVARGGAVRRAAAARAEADPGLRVARKRGAHDRGRAVRRLLARHIDIGGQTVREHVLRDDLLLRLVGPGLRNAGRDVLRGFLALSHVLDAGVRSAGRSRHDQCDER